MGNREKSYKYLLLINVIGAAIFVLALILFTHGFPEGESGFARVLLLTRIFAEYFGFNIIAGMILKIAIDFTCRDRTEKPAIGVRDWYVYVWAILMQCYLLICITDFNSTYSLVFMLLPITAMAWYVLFVVGCFAMWFKKNFRLK